MKRLPLLAVASFCSLLAIALPVSLAHSYSERRAAQMQESLLTEDSRTALSRVERTYGDAVAALKEVEAPHWSTCSAAHIAAMRLAAFNHHSISEIGFINKDHLLECTSWGRVDHRVPHGAYTFIRRDGVGIHLGVKPVVVQGNMTIALNLGQHNALVDPGRFLDMPVDKHVALAVANEDGHTVLMVNDPPAGVIARAIGDAQPGVLGQHLYASYRKDGWIAVAVENRRMAQLESHHQEAILDVPALLGAALLITGIGLATRHRLSPLGRLRTAVREKEFVPHYQPIMNLATGRCVGAEALVRWQSPDRGLLTPDRFLALAEDSGLIEPMTDQLMERVVGDMGEAMRSDPWLHVTINLGCKDIETGRFLPLLAKLLEEQRLPASCLWLEATERGFMNADAARSTLERARRQGHKVAIDDFGTGYSSLSLLHSLPLDVLKIDKSFVRAIAPGSATGTALVNIIDIAAGLDLEIIAEGIEREEQAAYLLSRNVLYGQGYLYGKPMPRDEFLAFYRSHDSHAISGWENCRSL